jgi:tRNA(Ile)-lysidine synthetase-like protein
LWRVMSRMAGTRPVGFEHVAAAIRMLEPDGPSSFDAPGHRVERIGGTLVLTGRPAGTRGRVDRAGAPARARLASSANLFRYQLSIPGEVRLAEVDCIVSAERASAEADAHPGVRAEATALNGAGNLAIVRGDLCRGSLAVRNRRPGDRFRPPGLVGRKKLQDFFVDRKVSRAERDVVPLVVDEADRIVWVAGYGIDEAFRVTDPGQAVLTLRVRPTR